YLSSTHSLSAEWEFRQQSTARLLTYLSQRRASRILDLGCGNGWLTGALARMPHLSKDGMVVGADVNLPELQQAARVFALAKCQFVHIDVTLTPFPDNSFDCIIVNAAIQYFPHLTTLIQILLKMLTPEGELHLLDSPLYTATSVDGASTRSKAYYASINCEDMAAHYFHHTWQDLAPFTHEVLYVPNRYRRYILRLLGRKETPFPWVKIKKT
nr:class I SAM-dependent methyltransferase [Saprospiraceae bacterium]